jgi:hypothetical protein
VKIAPATVENVLRFIERAKLWDGPAKGSTHVFVVHAGRNRSFLIVFT